LSYRPIHMGMLRKLIFSYRPMTMKLLYFI